MMRLQHFAPLAGLAATFQAGLNKMVSGLDTGIGVVGPVSTDWVTSVVRKLLDPGLPRSMSHHDL